MAEEKASKKAHVCLEASAVISILGHMGKSISSNLPPYTLLSYLLDQLYFLKCITHHPHVI